MHFVGIGGAGLSALALVGLNQGFRISGSDRDGKSPRLVTLREAGATVFAGHTALHLTSLPGGPPDAVVVSSAVPPSNPELVAARAMGIRVYKRDQWLAMATERFRLAAVAGTHGKTSSTSMLACALVDGGADPTVVVGGEVAQLGGRNARLGRSDLFVLEADEYDYAFLGLRPTVAIVTSIEWDHPDIFPTPQSVADAFVQFAHQVRPGGTLLACGDTEGSRALATVFDADDADRGGRTALTYGIAAGCDWRAAELVQNTRGGVDFVASGPGLAAPVRISLAVPGTHNVQNALAVFACACLLGVAPDSAARSLGAFGGVARRFQSVGDAPTRHGQLRGKAQIFDDYAHHPTAVTATLEAATKRFPGARVWACFQPHTYSRLTSLLAEFQGSFRGAAKVLVTPVYGARDKEARGTIDHTTLVAGVAAYTDCRAVASLQEAEDVLAAELADGDVVITMGAGDITHLGYDLRARMIAESEASST